MNQEKKKIILFLSLILFITSIFLYGIAYHNVDLSFNMSKFQIDINPFGIVKNKNDLHLTGLQALLISVIFEILGYFFLLGIYL